ncbi:substrate-binding periplasmic protein [Rugamonas sp. CCM 8940]|uniref:substrate-binding periplasmic protein n=1 Tax=Rugamonas sp. CCM 8940 TaxID=2765359 RepID=UPI0018F66C8D|nr:transporter substrate-binding domain-containing protein [Rugamonas sp. CCM 8940]MBJ7311841.1 transporter substrate-binding domain-containing protein [Rugamonas sp. CCM 8940]
MHTDHYHRAPPGRRRRGALALLLACAAGWPLAVSAAAAAAAVHRTQAGELVVLVDTGTEMPMAQFHGGQLSGGIHMELGRALAQKMGKTPRFLALPRKRIALALNDGQADLLCMYVPAWLPGQFLWSEPFFPMSEVLVTQVSAARPHALAELAGQPIATVLGYTYPILEQALGGAFVRDDGPSNESNFRKMAVGRMHHVLTQQSSLDYHQKVGSRLQVHPPLLVKHYLGQCAVSPRGQASLAEVNAAIAQLLRDGAVQHIMANYR